MSSPTIDEITEKMAKKFIEKGISDKKEIHNITKEIIEELTKTTNLLQKPTITKEQILSTKILKKIESPEIQKLSKQIEELTKAIKNLSNRIEALSNKIEKLKKS